MFHFFYTLVYVIPRLIAATTTCYTDQVLGILRLYWFVISRKLRLTQADFPVVLAVAGTRQTLWLRRPMDIAVLREIYVDREYDWILPVTPQVIVDIGAHFGDTALYYHALYPQATIIAVEPSPANFERLQKNTAAVTNIHCVQAAVGSIDGVVHLDVSGSPLGFTVSPVVNTQSVAVTQLTLSSVLARYGYTRADLIKFDVEGAEYGIFAAAENGGLADYFIGEVHADIVKSTLQQFLLPFGDAKIDVVETRPGARYLVKIDRRITGDGVIK